MSEAIKATMRSPGWAEIKQQAQNRLDAAKALVWTTQNEAEAIRRWRLVWAAVIAYEDFLNELEENNEQQPVPDVA